MQINVSTKLSVVCVPHAPLQAQLASVLSLLWSRNMEQVYLACRSLHVARHLSDATSCICVAGGLVLQLIYIYISLYLLSCTSTESVNMQVGTVSIQVIRLS